MSPQHAHSQLPSGLHALSHPGEGSQVYSQFMLCHRHTGEGPALPEAGVSAGETHSIKEAKMYAPQEEGLPVSLAAVCQAPRPGLTGTGLIVNEQSKQTSEVISDKSRDHQENKAGCCRKELLRQSGGPLLIAFSRKALMR